jgi:hypothetical protein
MIPPAAMQSGGLGLKLHAIVEITEQNEAFQSKAAVRWRSISSFQMTYISLIAASAPHIHPGRSAGSDGG